MGSHDPLFKRLLQRFFADFLRIVAPDVAARLDLSAPVFLDKELNLPVGDRIVDLLARVPVASLHDEEHGMLVNCIETYLQLSPREAEELAALGVPPDRRAQIVSTSLFTWTDRLFVEGKKQGLREALLDLLQDRFGPIPDEVRQRVEKIRSEDRLSLLLRKVLTARTLKEMRLG